MKFQIIQSNNTIIIDGIQHNIAPRKCDYTGVLMHSGYVICDDYCADTEEAKTKALLDHNFDSWEEMQDHYGEEEMYWTEWEIYDEFYTDNELYFTLNESLLWEQVILQD